MNKKAVSWMVIGVVIVAVVVVGVVAQWAMTSGGGENGGEETPDVAGATSLQFDVIATVEGDQQNYKFMAKNLGTSEVMMRVELVDPTGAEFIYLLNEAEQEAWAYWDGAWEDISATFSTYQDMWNPNLDDYKTNLADWTGTGDYEYTDSSGSSIKVSNIVVNPTLEDSLFQPD